MASTSSCLTAIVLISITTQLCMGLPLDSLKNSTSVLSKIKLPSSSAVETSKVGMQKHFNPAILASLLQPFFSYLSYASPGAGNSIASTDYTDTTAAATNPNTPFLFNKASFLASLFGAVPGASPNPSYNPFG